MKKQNKERILYTIIALIFILALVEAYNMPPKISMYPRLICWLGSALSLILIIQSFMQGRMANKSAYDECGQEDDRYTAAQMRRIFISLGIVVAYIIGIGFLGYVVSTLTFMIGFMVFLKRNMRFLYVVVSCVFVAVIYFSFVNFLKIPLPSGIFF